MNLLAYLLHMSLNDRKEVFLLIHTNSLIRRKKCFGCVWFYKTFIEMKYLNFVVILLVICVTKIEITNSAKILEFLVTLSRSHLVVEEPIMRELARRGHEVILIHLNI